MWLSVCRRLEWVGPVGSVQQRVWRRDPDPKSDLSVTSGGVVPVRGRVGGGPSLQLPVLLRWAAQRSLIKVSDWGLFWYRVGRVKAIFPFFFQSEHLAHLLLCPSSVSQCADLGSACWKGDFDRWKIRTTGSTCYMTAHAQHFITPTNVWTDINTFMYNPNSEKVSKL